MGGSCFHGDRILGSAVVRELDITEFRGIRRLAKPLELSSFNVLIGRNNVGKTAVLEALYMLTMPLPHTIPPPYGRGVVDFIAEKHGGSAAREQGRKWSLLVYGYAGTAVLKYRLGVKAKTSIPTKIGSCAEAALGFKEVSIESIQVEISSERDLLRVLADGVELESSSYESFLASMGADLKRSPIALYVPNDSSAYAQISSYVMRDDVFSWIEKEGAHRRAVQDIIAPAVYDKFTEVTIRRNELCVRKEVSEEIGPLYIGVGSLGEGVKRVLLIYMLVEYLKPKLLLWDDLEVAAHPSLLESVLRWLASSRRQVVVSTHSIDVLHTITVVRPRDCRVLVLRKSPQDVMEYKALTLDDIEDILESGVDPRKIIEELEL